MQFWKELEGNTFAGRYTLGALLRFTDQSAWFAAQEQQTKNGQGGCVAFLASSQTDDDQRLKDLEAACRVKHSNVVGIEKTGRARVGDKSFVYAILEATEENLGEVLRERSLTPDETAQITESLVAGLAAIHEQGLAHGKVNPANIWAAGDTVKLSSDCLQRVTPEERAEAFAQDTGDLGATVFEALTQRKLSAPDDPAIERLPVPFRSIVHSAVVGRWGLPEIAMALKKPGLEEIRHPVPAAQPAAKQAARATVPETPPATPRAPVIAATPVLTHPVKPRRSPVVLVAVILLIALLGIFWFVMRGASRKAALPDEAPAVAPLPPSSATSAEAAPPVSTAPAPPSAPTPPVALSRDAGDHRIWRVVVYTFAHQSAAEHKVVALSARHPEWKPEVFSASGSSPWLVTVGGAMDHEQAFALRDQVRGKGLPRDAYAQNYTH